MPSAFMQAESLVSLPKNDKRTINAWAVFDWANSAYALVITAAIFPGYFLAMTSDVVDVFGIRMRDSTLYAWSISFAYLVIAVLSPVLSGIADYGGRKKTFLRFFTLLGSLACIGLLFFTGMPTLWVGVLCFILATIGFAGGIVFYNAFLPIIVTEDRYDDVSARGFSYGFAGSLLLLVLNLVVIQNYGWFGFPDALRAVPVAFVMVGLWWIGFSQIPLRRLPADRPGEASPQLFKKGMEELRKVWAYLKSDRNMLMFLLVFFLFNSGTQALLFLASIFAEKELGFDTSGLIVLIMVLQIVGILGAWGLAKVSDLKGNKFALMLVLCIWVVICIGGFFVRTGIDFYILAAFVGLSMGGTQSLSRSTYAKFFPVNTPDTASYYSFYDVIDKVSTVAGTFVFGIVEQITHGMRASVLVMGVFYLTAIMLFSVVRIGRKAGPESAAFKEIE